MRFLRFFALVLGMLGTGCPDPDEGDLTEPPDGSHCHSWTPDFCDPDCVDTSSDVFHCGGCHVVCALAEHAAGVACVSGACVVDGCEAGFADCDGQHDNGCEAELATSNEHCGACDNACATDCRAGACDDPIEVSAGPSYTCALRASGSVWCWGDNAWGNLGTGAPDASPVPAKVDLPAPALAIGTGRFAARMHTCAVLEGGALFCWGANGDGQLGVGDEIDAPLPVVVGLENVTQVAVGGLHTCAATSDKNVRCWGANSLGQLGSGTTNPSNVPVMAFSNAAEIAAGARHSCARYTSGTVACWGENVSGQIGNDSNVATPVALLASSLTDAVALGLGARHSCALHAGGLSCWGENQDGQLGLASTMDMWTPQLVPVRGATRLVVGLASSGVLIDGELWAWGANADAQLGLGHPQPVLAPERTSLGPLVRAAIGERHGCAIRPSGELICWGANEQGQLGSGDTKPTASPVTVVFPKEAP